MKTINCDSITIGYSSEVANSFDSVRASLKYERRMSALAQEIAQSAPVASTIKLLDLGCGSGLFTIELAKRLNCIAIGADRSEDMLAIAQRKSDGNLVRWDTEEATSLSYNDGEFDVVFMANLLHHFDNPHKVIEQCMRILRPDGILVNHYGALEDIIDDPEHKFFPECVQIDEARTPTKNQVESWWRQAGFEKVHSTKAAYQICASAVERVKCVENKYVSVLHMIGPLGFQNGLERLREYATKNPSDKWLQEIVVTTTYGRKASNPK